MTDISAADVFTHADGAVFRDKQGDTWRLARPHGFRPSDVIGGEPTLHSPGDDRVVTAPHWPSLAAHEPFTLLGVELPPVSGDADAHRRAGFAWLDQHATGWRDHPSTRSTAQELRDEVIVSRWLDDHRPGWRDVPNPSLYDWLTRRDECQHTAPTAPFASGPAPIGRRVATTHFQFMIGAHVASAGGRLWVVDRNGLLGWDGVQLLFSERADMDVIEACAPYYIITEPPGSVSSHPGLFGAPVKTFADGGQEYGPHPPVRRRPSLPRRLVDAQTPGDAQTYGPLVEACLMQMQELAAALGIEPHQRDAATADVTLGTLDALWSLTDGLHLTGSDGTEWETVDAGEMCGVGVRWLAGRAQEPVHYRSSRVAQLDVARSLPFTVEPFRTVADLMRLPVGVELRDRDGGGWVTDQLAEGPGIALYGRRGGKPYWHEVHPGEPGVGHVMDGVLPFPFTYVP